MIYLAAAIIVILIVFLALGLNNNLTITRHTLESDKLDQPFKAVLLTDLHSGIYGDNQEELIAEIDKQKPDIIFISGDIAD